MSEENGARMRAESRVVEVEKQCSMLEFDLKQSVQKMEQLMKQKERLEDEASHRWSKFFFVFFSPRCWKLETYFVPSQIPSAPQVKGLRIQIEQESSKRVLAMNDLKSRTLEVDRLRCTEKQLKQEINTAQESKRSLEFQLAQLTK